MLFTTVLVIAQDQLTRDHHEDDDTERRIHRGPDMDSLLSVDPGHRWHLPLRVFMAVVIWLHVSNRASTFLKWGVQGDGKKLGTGSRVAHDRRTKPADQERTGVGNISVPLATSKKRKKGEIVPRQRSIDFLAGLKRRETGEEDMGG